MSLQKISQVARDPLAHLSIEAGEGIALLIFGLCVGWITHKIVAASTTLSCWFG